MKKTTVGISLCLLMAVFTAGQACALPNATQLGALAAAAQLSVPFTSSGIARGYVDMLVLDMSTISSANSLDGKVVAKVVIDGVDDDLTGIAAGVPKATGANTLYLYLEKGKAGWSGYFVDSAGKIVQTTSGIIISSAGKPTGQSQNPHYYLGSPLISLYDRWILVYP